MSHDFALELMTITHIYSETFMWICWNAHSTQSCMQLC